MNALPVGVPLCGLVMLVVADVLFAFFARREDLRRILATIAWTFPALAALIVLVVLGSRGWCHSPHVFAPSALLIVIVLSGMAVLPRERFISLLEGVLGKRSRLFSYVRDFVILSSTVAVALLSIEWPWNDWLLFFSPWKILINGIPVAVVFIALYFIGQRRGVLVAVGSVAALVIGLAQYFVLMFKGASIKPSDLFAIGTALTVTGGYEFIIGARQLLCIALTCWVIALLAYMRPLAFGRLKGEREPWRGRAILIIARTCGGVALLAVLVVTLAHVNLSDTFGLTRSYWDSRYVYENQGFIASFISLCQNSIISAPEEYTHEEAEMRRDVYAQDYLDGSGSSPERAEAESQYAEQQPTVIAVMNESFSDLSIYDGLRTGYEGPRFATGIPDALYRGNVYVSVVGGGTCNSEFEFLAGASLAFIGAENQPYITHDLSDIESLPKVLGAEGYSSTAMHPMPGQNWNRDVIYPAMGFDTFMDGSMFPEDAPARHAGKTDAVTYAEILELVEQGDGPQFFRRDHAEPWRIRELGPSGIRAS